MPNLRLRLCPTCHRELEPSVRERMGLRNGEILNDLCPGRNGPSDIDHVLHNGHHPDGDRVMFLEYKGGGKLLTQGQRILKAALEGEWQDLDGRRLFIRYAVLPQRVADPTWLLEPIVRWVWPLSVQEASA